MTEQQTDQVITKKSSFFKNKKRLIFVSIALVLLIVGIAFLVFFYPSTNQNNSKQILEERLQKISSIDRSQSLASGQQSHFQQVASELLLRLQRITPATYLQEIHAVRIDFLKLLEERKKICMGDFQQITLPQGSNAFDDLTQKQLPLTETVTKLSIKERDLCLYELKKLHIDLLHSSFVIRKAFLTSVLANYQTHLDQSKALLVKDLEKLYSIQPTPAKRPKRLGQLKQQERGEE